MKENNAYRDCFRYDKKVYSELCEISKYLKKVGEKNTTTSCIKYAIRRAYLLLKLNKNIKLTK